MTDAFFRIFLSWSGKKSLAVATVLHDWLPTMFDGVVPWMSDVDIQAGSRGLADIEAALADTRFGIVVATQSNQHAPWLNFEGGALSKAVGNKPALVAPLLVDFAQETDLTGPLQQFQCNLMTQEGVRRVVSCIADLLSVPNSGWEPRFLALWPSLASKLDEAGQTVDDHPKSATRSSEDVLAEVLSHVRSLVRLSDYAGLPRKPQDLGDEFDYFVKTLDLPIRTHFHAHDGEHITRAGIGLSKQVEPEIVDAIRNAVRERFGVELDVTVHEDAITAAKTFVDN